MNTRATVLVEVNEIAAAMDRLTAAIERLEAKVAPAEVDAYTIDQAAQRLGLTPRRVRGAIDRGELRTKRVGLADLIPAAEIQRLLA